MVQTRSQFNFRVSFTRKQIDDLIRAARICHVQALKIEIQSYRVGDESLLNLSKEMTNQEIMLTRSAAELTVWLMQFFHYPNLSQPKLDRSLDSPLYVPEMIVPGLEHATSAFLMAQYAQLIALNL